MADAIIDETPNRRHKLAGRKQNPEHIAKRTAAIAAVKAKWSAEKREQVRQNFKAAQTASSSSAETKHRRSVSHRRTSDLETKIYGLVDPVSKQLRYIGKTTAALSRRWSIHSDLAKRKTPRHIYNWWRSLSVEPEIFEIDSIPPGGDWVEAEQFWIAYFKFVGCDLVNSCDGGQGTTGIKFSAEHIERLRVSHRGNIPTEESLRKRSEGSKAAWARNPASRWKPETIAKMLATKAPRRAAGLYKKRVPATEETKAKISAGKRGKPLSEEHKAKLSKIRQAQEVARKLNTNPLR